MTLDEFEKLANAATPGPWVSKRGAIKIGNECDHTRAGRKNPALTVQDLEKAVWYLNRKIERMVTLNRKIERMVDSKNSGATEGHKAK